VKATAATSVAVTAAEVIEVGNKSNQGSVKKGNCNCSCEKILTTRSRGAGSSYRNRSNSSRKGMHSSLKK
jgi:hypothetical protein